MQDDADQLEHWRTEVGLETRKLESEYDTLMYGGVSITQVSSVCWYEQTGGTPGFQAIGEIAV